MRRTGSILTTATVLAAGLAWSTGSLQGSVASLRELDTREQATHVLNRMAFGPRPGDVDRVMQMGVDRWIELQLDPARIPDPAGRDALEAFPTMTRSGGDLLREFPPAALQEARRRLAGDSTISRADSMAIREATLRSQQFVNDILAAKVARAVVSERQLAEVMTDFWENHFNVYLRKNQIRYFLPEYIEETIRPHVLGNFRDLLGSVAKSPAMLLYLDNAQSVADSGAPTLGRSSRVRVRNTGDVANRRARMADSVRQARASQLQTRRRQGLNENYARELMELHTLGVDGGYTQQDVIEVARALTGWSVNPPRQGGDGFVFRAAAHDAGPKVVLGHPLKAGRGIEDGEEVLDILARHPSTARHIARELAVRFVSDEPPDDLVDRAAATFTRTNGNIREVVRTIVTSPEFFSRAAYRSKVKSPFEVTVSALRAIGASVDSTAVTARLVGQLGQPLYGHLSPDGWPETGAEWMNTGAILNRIKLGIVVASGRLPGAPLRGWPDFQRLARAPRDSQVDAVIASILSGSVSPETREILISGANPLMPRAVADSTQLTTDLDDDSMAGRTRTRGGASRGRLNRLPELTGLPQVIGLAIGSPEFQRR